MVVNLFFGTVINAARGVSGQIQSAIQGFCENLVIAFRPQLVQSYAQGNIERTEKMMFSIVIWIILRLWRTMHFLKVFFELSLKVQ